MVEHRLAPSAAAKFTAPELPKDAPSRFAVVTCSGTQFKVMPGDRIIVNKVDAAVGSTYTFEHVLLVGERERTFIGRPYIESATVTATVEEQTKDAKVIVFKRRRKNHKSKRTNGFRREVTFLRVNEIVYDAPVA